MAPVHGTAGVHEEDGKKEEKKDIKEEEQEEKKQENKEGQTEVVSAASIASVGQELSGRHLLLKLEELLLGRTSSKDSSFTLGLHVFEDSMFGEEAFGLCLSRLRASFIIIFMKWP